MYAKTLRGETEAVSTLKEALSPTLRIGYKVVTADMRSLGLRNNPNILEYPVGRWFFLPDKEIIEGRGDYGGIWVVRTLSAARRLGEYMKEKHGTETRIYEALLDKILYSNSYRVKTNGILLLKRV